MKPPPSRIAKTPISGRKSGGSQNGRTTCAPLVIAIWLLAVGLVVRVEAADPVRPSNTIAGPTSPRGDQDDLVGRRKALEGKVPLVKARLEAAQIQFAYQTAAADLEKAKRLDGEVKDLQTRYAAVKAELEQVEKQLADGPLETAAAEQAIQPGESLAISVAEEPSFNGNYQVRRGGYIILPQLGRVAIAGQSLSGVEATIKRALEGSKLLATASVTVKHGTAAYPDAGPLIFLSGDFRNPRAVHIQPEVVPTLANAICTSGGVTHKADLVHVRLTRIVDGRSVTEEVDVAKILRGGGRAADPALSEGDVITIPGGASPSSWLSLRAMGGPITNRPPSPAVQPINKDDLMERRQALPGEVRYAKAKMDRAASQLALETVAGDLEKAEQLSHEAQNWQARYTSAKEELEKMEKEIAAVFPKTEGARAKRIIKPGDSLAISAAEDPSFHGVYRVRRSGYVTLPQIGRIPVAGKTPFAVQATIQWALEFLQIPNTSVMVMRVQTDRKNETSTHRENDDRDLLLRRRRLTKPKA